LAPNFLDRLEGNLSGNNANGIESLVYLTKLSHPDTGKSDVDYIYLVDAYWDGSDTRAIAWDDPDLNIPWPVKNPIISERDRGNPKLRDLFPKKFNKK